MKKEKGNTPNHLRLVSSRTKKRRDLMKAVQQPNNPGFNSLSLSKTLERKTQLLQRISAPGYESIDAAIRAIKEKIIELLHARDAVLQTRVLQRKGFAQWAEEITKDLHVRYQLIDYLSGIAPENDFRQDLITFGDYVRNFCPNVVSRQQIEQALIREGIQIQDTDTTRLLVREINNDHLCPKIIGLPNEQNLFDPSYVALEGEEPLPGVTTRLLRVLGI